jgi:hypothetical protein
MMRTIELGTSRIAVLPVVKGLVSEADEVPNAFSEVRPEAIAVSISREELEALRNRDDYADVRTVRPEIIYQAFLERWGRYASPRRRSSGRWTSPSARAARSSPWT